MSLLTFRQYADGAGINVSSVSRAVARGHIPTMNRDGQRLIDADAADRARERRFDPHVDQALKALTDEQGKRAVARAMNELGKTMRGKVIRATAKQVGASQAAVKKRGRITSKPATAGRLSYVISSQGGHMLLKDFGAKQNREGVRAKPWGRGAPSAAPSWGPVRDCRRGSSAATSSTASARTDCRSRTCTAGPCRWRW